MSSLVIPKIVLAIETSCDDTSISIVKEDGEVLALSSANQDLAHAPHGGIVPEIASRNHTVAILPLIESCFQKSGLSWKDIQGIAVTNRPGLIGSLIVGLMTAKTLAQVYNLPLIGVNHLEGHLLAPFLRDSQYAPPADFNYPYLGLAISGGHTSLYCINGLGEYDLLGATLDDAAGEAFDKFGKMLGLGFPGGVKVDLHSKTGNSKAYSLPRALIREENYNMSFSGLKASAQRLVQSIPPEELEKHLPDLCASFQEAVVEALLAKLDRAVSKTGIKKVILTGGVSANSRLRTCAQEWALKKNVQLVIPPIRYCTDNAAMIGYAGLLRLQRGERDDLNLGPYPHLIAGDINDQRVP